jgi:hypothetical protein
MPKNQTKKDVGLFKKKKPHFVKNAKFQKKKIPKKLDGVLPAMSRLRLNNYAKKNPQVHTKKKQEKLDEELRSVWKRMDKLRKDFYGQEKKLKVNPLDEKKGNKNEKSYSVQDKKKEESIYVKIDEKKKPKKNKKKESLDGKIEKKNKTKKNKKKEESIDEKIEKKKTVIHEDVPKPEYHQPVGDKGAARQLINRKKIGVMDLDPITEKKLLNQVHKIDFDEYENITNGHLLIGGKNKRSMWVDSNYSSSSSHNNHSSGDHDDTKNGDSNRWTNNHLDQNEELINENEEIIKAMNDQRMNSFLYGVSGPLGMNNNNTFPGSSVRSD